MGERDAAENPFALLGIAESFAVDGAALRDALRRASLRWHPDRFALAPPAERAAAEERMTAVNALPTTRTPRYVVVARKTAR